MTHDQQKPVRSVGQSRFGCSMKQLIIDSCIKGAIDGDHKSPKGWEENRRPNIFDMAAGKLQAILGSHYPAHSPAHHDDRPGAALPVRLSRNMMERA
jgi:hypothetical protein